MSNKVFHIEEARETRAKRCLQAKFGTSVETTYFGGKEQFRDVVCHTTKLSLPESEKIIDALELSAWLQFWPANAVLRKDGVWTFGREWAPA